MRREYDFSTARRGEIVPVTKGKTRITIRLDDELVQWFKRKVHAEGGGNYQTMINEALRSFVSDQKKPMESLLRRVVREELRRAGGHRRSKSAA